MGFRLIFAILLCSRSWAQDTSAPVRIDGKEVVRIYGPLGSFIAKDRATAIEGRIIALAKQGFTGHVDESGRSPPRMPPPYSQGQCS